MSGFKIKVQSGGDFEMPSPGVKVGVCTRVVDWGTQSWGQFGPKRRVQISFETAERTSDGRPMSVSRMYTLSMNEKANLRRDLESWRGKPYDDGQEADLSRLIGQCAMLNLVRDPHTERVNIAGIMPLPEGMTPIAPVEDTVCFFFDDPDWDQFNKLHERTKEKLEATPEWDALKSNEERDRNAQAYAQASAGGSVQQTGGPVRHYGDREPGSDDDKGGASFDDEIPFAQHERGAVI